MSELSRMKNECYRLVDIIVSRGEINKKDLFIALAIRLRLPINNCFINNFSEETIKKTIKELKYMLDL